ncbi:MAG: hypothetical protein CME90_11045 [Hoeflea sp.]|nr:hypothetical protein [Hoeflea sp.]|tara:strand:+ start:21930 stop:22550 length:621 start_codon:yes stop_codon:yes gene_type:complete
MDDLTRIKGIGAATAKKLAAAGYASFADLANAAPTEDTLAGIANSPEQSAAWIEAAGTLAAEASPPSGDEAGQQVPTHTPESEDRGGGGGNPAAPVGETLPAGNGAAAAGAEPKQGDKALDVPNWAKKLAAENLRAICPLLIAALDEWGTETETLPTSLIISSKREGFRRAGIAHTRAEVSHEIGAFTLDQIEQLLAEPVLKVRLA